MNYFEWMKREVKAFLGIVWPRRCIVCGEPLDVDEKWVCESCAGDFPYTWFWAFEENPAEERLWKRVGIVAAASLFFYRKDGGYGELLHEVKYGGNLRLGRHLGRELGRRMREGGRFADVQAVVPVPLHPLRRWRRGYNQAEVIAHGIAEGLNGVTASGAAISKPPAVQFAGTQTEAQAAEVRPPVRVETRVLRRSRYTRTQTRLSGESKRRNVQNAFALNLREAERLKSEGILHVLVVDDLMTSGSTLEAAIKPLLPHFLISVATVGFVE